MTQTQERFTHSLMTALPKPQTETHICIAGEMLQPQISGALWWQGERVLVVSDLHLEKGSSYAKRGQMLPPYDTGATLGLVETLCDELKPHIVISLGDSFHDRSAELRLPLSDTERICALTSRYDWVWVEGNHDPDPPAYLGGRAEKALRIGALVFRHEPTGERGEIAGHLHPVAKVRSKTGRSVRRRCFVSDANCLIMPAFGAFTGGLNVLDEAFEPLFPDGFVSFALGSQRVFSLDGRLLIPDQRAGSALWKL